MLGAARASQYAGWWGSDPKFVSTTATAMNYAGQYLDAVSVTPNLWSSPLSGKSFDNTGVANGSRGTQVVTFKYAAQSNFVWQTDAFRTAYQSIDYNSPNPSAVLSLSTWFYEYQSTTQDWNIRLGRTVTGQYLSVFGTFSGYEWFTLPGNLTWDSLADRWMTLIVSYSDTAADFVNWTGATPPSPTYWYLRITLQDARTGELISTTDVRYLQFQNHNTNWADYTWSWANGSSGSSTTANVRMANLAGPSVVNFDKTDMLAAAWWGSAGAVIDPLATVNGVQLRQYFVGQCFPETVNSVRAWGNFTPFDLTTDVSDSYLTKALPGRMSQSSLTALQQSTATLVTPNTDASIP